MKIILGRGTTAAVEPRVAGVSASSGTVVPVLRLGSLRLPITVESLGSVRSAHSINEFATPNRVVNYVRFDHKTILWRRHRDTPCQFECWAYCRGSGRTMLR